jgi:hypothetical protein
MKKSTKTLENPSFLLYKGKKDGKHGSQGKPREAKGSQGKPREAKGSQGNVWSSVLCLRALREKPYYCNRSHAGHPSHHLFYS